MLVNVDELIKDVIDACVALAAHFHGNGGISIELKSPEEHDGSNGLCTIKKYDKVLYVAEGDCPHCVASELVGQIVEKERVQKCGPRHKKCPVCNYIFGTIHDKLKMFEVAHRFAGSIAKALGRVVDLEDKKVEVPSSELN